MLLNLSNINAAIQLVGFKKIKSDIKHLYLLIYKTFSFDTVKFTTNKKKKNKIPLYQYDKAPEVMSFLI